MDEWITTTEAGRRLGKKSGRWLAKLCQQHRVEGARKIGNQWLLPVGAKVLPPIKVLPPVAPGRPLRTLEIPREGKKGGKQ